MRIESARLQARPPVKRVAAVKKAYRTCQFCEGSSAPHRFCEGDRRERHLYNMALFFVLRVPLRPVVVTGTRKFRGEMFPPFAHKLWSSSKVGLATAASPLMGGEERGAAIGRHGVGAHNDHLRLLGLGRHSGFALLR